MQTTVV